MSLAIVRSNSLLFCGPCDKVARIWQQPELMYGAVMALLAPCRVYTKGILKGRKGRDEVKNRDEVTESIWCIARETLESAFIWDSERARKMEIVGNRIGDEYN